jgi:hypothetical protein
MGLREVWGGQLVKVCEPCRDRLIDLAGSFRDAEDARRQVSKNHKKLSQMLKGALTP